MQKAPMTIFADVNLARDPRRDAPLAPVCAVYTHIMSLALPTGVKPRRLPRRARACLGVVMMAALGCAFASASAAPPARALDKGLCEPRLDDPSAGAAARGALIQEIGPGLHARWVRLVADWSRLEPQRGAYVPAEVQRLDDLVDGLHARGVKVMFTTCSLPAWASDQYWWAHPPAGFPEGYQPFYPIRDDALTDYARLGEFLAKHFRGRVQALECWNEPNLWPFLYPQRTPTDGYFAARVYLRMLKAFHAGVTRAGTGVRVVAGATAPVGLNDRMRTSPQRFARFLKRQHAGRYFDVYSHHPYTPGGSFLLRPDQPPNDPTTTVTLYNLGTLLRLFPGKPFYLTEYGYGTRYSQGLGLTVTRKQQAAYLRRAYALARSYKQVRMLLWFLLYDLRPSGQPAEMGWYTGLRDAAGGRKPAWYAFRAVRP